MDFIYNGGILPILMGPDFGTYNYLYLQYREVE